MVLVPSADASCHLLSVAAVARTRHQINLCNTLTLFFLPQVVQAGAAAAVAAPLLRTKPAEAIGGPATFDNFPGRAPVITVLDHRGCSRKVCSRIPAAFSCNLVVRRPKRWKQPRFRCVVEIGGGSGVFSMSDVLWRSR